MAPVPRKWWFAVLLTFCTPGLGQLYNGQPKKAAAVYVAAPPALFGIVAIAFTLLPAPMNIVIPLALVLGWFGYILVDAVVGARRRSSAYEPRPFNRWYFYVAAIAISGLVVQPALSGLIRAFVVKAYRMPTTSMAPTLLDGDFILADRSASRWGAAEGESLELLRSEGTEFQEVLSAYRYMAAR